MSRFIIGLFLSAMILSGLTRVSSFSGKETWWDFQSIDTMKYSRDTSREYLEDLDQLEILATEQISLISQTGATHVGIATPYDEEFLPVLETWVTVAREHNLNVWFRGNWSGWEEWFDYDGISREQHLEKTRDFIRKNPDLFEDGDVFSACPECENGGPGDPRMNGDAEGHRAFLIAEYRMMQEEFLKHKKKVITNYNSMNGDVANLIMDRETTRALGGIVVVDHYVETPEQLNEDVTRYAERSGGKVVLGEFGAPIPDIHGDMTPEEQAAWLDQAVALLAKNPNLAGLNYWTGFGGSTELWGRNNEPLPAVAVLSKYFQPPLARGVITDTRRRPVPHVEITSQTRSARSDENGQFVIAHSPEETVVRVTAAGYKSQTVLLEALSEGVTLEPLTPSAWYRFQVWVNRLLPSRTDR
jgi:hypothetical protein